VAALAAVVALVVILLSGGSHTSAPRGLPASASPTGAGAASTAGARASAASGAPAPSGSSAALRKLIAYGKPIYCGAPRGNEVALTFDDGPGVYTRLVLAKLRKHAIAATFFDVGRNIPLLAGATQQERALGAIGDHTFTHPVLTALAPGEADQQIARTQVALERSSGGPVFLFRPPYGARNARIDAIAHDHGLLQIMWTVDSADSLGANYAQIEQNVIAGLRGGSIILMHENHGQTVRALLGIFAALARKHLHTVSVPQLLRDDPPSSAQLDAGASGCGVRHGALTGG
jgi:peptidoglycan/xylan/chitin deacetylase (PgdA/CDA1 family)